MSSTTQGKRKINASPSPVPPKKTKTGALKATRELGRLLSLDTNRARNAITLKVVLELIENGADVNHVTPLPFLIRAIHAGHGQIAMALISRGADVNRHASLKAWAGITPLIVACSTAGMLDVTKKLITFGANVDAFVEFDLKENPGAKARLQARGRNVVTDILYRQTALLEAVRNLDDQTVNFLLKSGADPESGVSTDSPPSLKVNNPLVVAAALNPFESYDIVEDLLRAGAKQRVEALIAAAEKSHKLTSDIMALIIEHGMGVLTAQDTSRLDYLVRTAVVTGRNSEITSLLRRAVRDTGGPVKWGCVVCGSHDHTSANHDMVVGNTRAVRSVQRALASQELHNSYYQDRGMDKARIDSVFNEWALSKNLTESQKAAYKQQLNVREAREFRDGVHQCIIWLAHKLHNSRQNLYAMLVEGETSTIKSSAWLAQPVIKTLGMYGIPPPAVIIPVRLGEIKSLEYIRHARRFGITNYIHVDDAMYSGHQNEEIAISLRKKLAATAGGTGVPPQTSHLYMATAYSTDVAYRRVNKQTSPELDVHVFASFKIPERKWFLNTGRVNEGGPTSTILPHKIPDDVSFGPASLSNLLNSRMPEPAYRRIKLS